jgi:hypothetical protein
MNITLAVFPVYLLLLACPLMMFGMMFGMPVVRWISSRLKGEKKPLSMSMSCMPGHSGDATQSTSAGSDAALQGRVIQLEAEVSAMRAQLQDAPSADIPHK